MIRTPLCPLCNQPPEMILDDGHQAFCGTEGCPAFTWDTHQDIDTLIAHVARIKDGRVAGGGGIVTLRDEAQ